MAELHVLGFWEHQNSLKRITYKRKEESELKAYAKDSMRRLTKVE